MQQLLEWIFPLNRSLTGDGVRMTLAALQTAADFEVHEVPSGTECYDWTVPDEWSVREAYLEQSGRRLVDFAEHPLHLVGYSEPMEAMLPLTEVGLHIHAENEAIPYRTSYYKRGWGFCMRTAQWLQFNASEPVRVLIDSTIEPGSMTYGEHILPGSSGREFLISTYCCHPAMANDNCSGLMAWTMLLRALQGRKLRHTYRFIVSPETIGALAYIHRHEHAIKGLEGGYCLNTCGGPDALSYKRSFEGDASVDRAVRLAFRDADLQHDEHEFDAAGNFERQYATPGLRIPVGSIHRSKYYDYPEYHTSADDLDFISPPRIESVVDIYLRAIENLEYDRRYHSLCPIGEPMLSKRGLYRPMGGLTGLADHESAIRWQLQAAGEWTLDTAEQSGLKVKTLARAGEELERAGLLREIV